jgi:acetyl-CoA carboxylase beta subunit
MKDIISYGAYLAERQKLKRKRPKTVRLKPLASIPEEDAVCFSCGTDLSKVDLYQNYRVCNSCGFHQSISAWERIYLLADPASFIEFEFYGTATDPSQLLGNETYEERIKEARERTGLSEAVVAGT